MWSADKQSEHHHGHPEATRWRWLEVLFTLRLMMPHTHISEGKKMLIDHRRRLSGENDSQAGLKMTLQSRERRPGVLLCLGDGVR